MTAASPHAVALPLHLTLSGEAIDPDAIRLLPDVAGWLDEICDEYRIVVMRGAPALAFDRPDDAMAFMVRWNWNLSGADSRHG